jgi:hypothetical protein
MTRAAHAPWCCAAGTKCQLRLLCMSFGVSPTLPQAFHHFDRSQLRCCVTGDISCEPCYITWFHLGSLTCACMSARCCRLQCQGMRAALSFTYCM